MDLQNLLKRQLHFGWWLIGLTITIVISIVLISTGETSSETLSNGHYQEAEYTTSGQLGMALVGISWVAYIVLWILAIINSAKIQSITKETAALVTFASLSFIPLLSIGHIIFAIIAKKKYNVISGTQSIDLRIRQQFYPNDNSIESKKQALRQAFIDGAITFKEYENKIKALDEASSADQVNK